MYLDAYSIFDLFFLISCFLYKYCFLVLKAKQERYRSSKECSNQGKSERDTRSHQRVRSKRRANRLLILLRWFKRHWSASRLLLLLRLNL